MEFAQPAAGATPEKVACRNCNGVSFEPGTDGFLSCTACGCTLGPGINHEPADTSRVRAFYQRVFYFNELLGQYQLFEPAIPEDLLVLLKEAYSKRTTWDELSRERVHTLCRSVSLKKDAKVSSLHWVPLPEEYSQRYRAKTGTPLRDLRHFGEKWRRISFELTGRRPPKLSVQCVESIRRFLATVSRVFEFIRHDPACRGGERCHRKHPCRKSIINSNYLIKKALLFYYKGNRRHPKYLANRPWLPGPSRDNRHQLRVRYFQPMVERVGGEWKKYWPRPGYF